LWPQSPQAVATIAVAGLAIAVLALLIGLWNRWSLRRDRRLRKENQRPWAELKLTASPDIGWFVGRIEIHNPSNQSLAIEELRVEKPSFMLLAPLPADGAGPRTAGIPDAKPKKTLSVSWIVNEPHLAHSDLAYAGEFLVRCAPSMIGRWTSANEISCRIVAHGRYRSAKARRLAIPAPGRVKL
jgi:hypothetical protein